MEPEFTVDSLVRHLDALKDSGVIDGSEFVLDEGLFSVSRIEVNEDEGTIILRSNEVDDALFVMNKEKELVF